MDRIQTLLARLIRQEQSERSLGNVQAAERFAEKVQNLLTKYDLNLTDINITEGSTGPEPVSHVLFRVSDKAGTKVWQALLLNGIAEANNCKVITVYKTNHYHIIGTETQRSIVMKLYVYFSDLAEHLANKERTERSEDTRFRNAYLFGFSTGITKRMIEKSKEVKRKAEELVGKQLGYSKVETALVRLNTTLVRIEQYKKEQFNTESTESRKVHFRESGYNLGQQAANRVAMTASTVKGQQ